MRTDGQWEKIGGDRVLTRKSEVEVYSSQERTTTKLYDRLPKELREKDE